MLEFLSQIQVFLKENKKLVVATVVKTWGSAPRQVGSCMIISDTGDIVGSVSGGCVEGAVLKKAQEVFESGKSQYLKFGVSDEEAWAVGLSCGGSIEVFVEIFLAHHEPKIWKVLNEALENNQRAILFTPLSENEETRHLLVNCKGELIGQDSRATITKIAAEKFNKRQIETFEFEGSNWFGQVFPKKSQLIIVGAAHITVDLIQLAKIFGFETILIDPRSIFTDKINFPTPPDKKFSDWPAEVLPDYDLDTDTYAVLLTHDPKIDDQALHILLPSNIAYIGALGSKKTHEKRVKRFDMQQCILWTK